MTFRVFWTPRAEKQMRELWATASTDSRERFLVALLHISTDLTVRPQDVGESRAANQRIAFFAPLVVTYDVDADRRLVRVAAVKLYGPAKGSA